MPHERRKGLLYSGAFHLMLVLLAITGLPSFFSLPVPEDHAITVELLPVSELSNVKPSQPKEESPKEKEQAKPSPPVKTAESPPPPEEKPAVKKEEKEKPKEKEKEKKKPDDKKDKKKKQEDDLAAVLKAVKETAQKERKEKAAESSDKEASKSSSSRYDDTMPLSLSEKDAIRNQIAQCWNVPAGAKDAHDLIVVLKLQYEQDGSLIKVELANVSKARYSSDSFFRAAADSAIRAVRQCSPLKDLPPEKFATWRDMELTFDPREMLF